MTRLDDELAELAELSPARFTGQLESIHVRLPEELSGPPRKAIRRMAAAFQNYWDACFSPYWPRMRTILQADITYRGRLTAQGGQSEMLNNISPSMSFKESRLSLHLARPHTELTVKVDGRGLMLVPTMFTSRAAAPVDLDEAPLVIYPARGQGAMWEAENIVNPRALAELLGKTRASLLTALATPASSTELGIRFGISTSAVNQHLRALRAVGLATSTRYGHSVLYFRSPLGSALLGTGELE
ncbi:ArsR/SmtB family transcription factor [Arthrobacter alpinus]|uniref:ArsR/SmtB family transcription factor n=1 Tax=Arthrobacter alpinus TaxID=656366 RepID=UPI003B8465F9